MKLGNGRAAETRRQGRSRADKSGRPLVVVGVCTSARKSRGSQQNPRQPGTARVGIKVGESVTAFVPAFLAFSLALPREMRRQQINIA